MTHRRGEMQSGAINCISFCEENRITHTLTKNGLRAPKQGHLMRI
jgi:hypothetical protein